MLKTPEKSKYRPTLEDLWSINPSGAVRNPACRAPNLQELSLQSLPKLSEDRSNRPFFHHSQYHCTKKGGLRLCSRHRNWFMADSNRIQYDASVNRNTREDTHAGKSEREKTLAKDSTRSRNSMT